MLGDYFDRCETTSYSDNEGSYSDQIDSDVEADLYGLIHHKENEEFSKGTPTREMFNITDKSIEKHMPTYNENSYLTDDVSFFHLFTSYETASKSSLSLPKSPCVEKSENSFTKLDGSTPNCLASNKSNQKPNEDIGIKRKIDSLVENEEKSWKKISVGSKTLSDLTDRKDHVDSSDSDDVIIFEPDSSKNFKTNLSEREIIELNSDDSSDTNFISSTSSFFDSKLSGKTSASFSNVKNDETISDLWHINNEDLYRTAKKSKFSNRYHDRMSQKCSNCNERGHVAKSCTLPQQKKCFICGGGHPVYSCQSAICSICFKKGHNSRRCWKACERRPCASCNMIGHIKRNCPDIWRRYHLTTSNYTIVKGRPLKQSVPLFCFNCGIEGHFGSECPRPRMQSFESSYPTWPLVISYEDHHKMNSKEGGHSRKFPEKRPNLNLQSKQKFKHAKKQRNKNLSSEHQNDKEMEVISKVNGNARKTAFQKNLLRQENNRMLVRERDFPRSPRKINSNVEEERLNRTLREGDFPKSLRKNKSNVEDERLNRTAHLPRSSEIMPVDDIPAALTLAEKKRIKRKEKRKRKQLRLLGLM